MSRYGYLGIETSLNGLTHWMQETLDLKGNTNQRYNDCLKLIIEYGNQHIKMFKRKGGLSTAAEYVAKKVSWNKTFPHFTAWCLKNYKKIEL